MTRRYGALFSLTALFLLVLGIVAPSQTFACDGTRGTDFFNLKEWHYYLPCAEDGGIDNSEIQLNQVWLIGLAVFETMLVVGAIAAIVFIIWGGIKYITSQGSPDATANARKTIINAIAGLVILVSSSAVVTIFVNALGTQADTSSRLQIPNGEANEDSIERFLNFGYAVIGLVALIYVIIGAIKFATSTGDPGKAAQARNTILYAIIGLVVAVSATIITTYVLNQVQDANLPNQILEAYA